MLTHKGVMVTQEFKEEVFNCAYPEKVSAVTNEMLEDFIEGRIIVSFALIPLDRECKARLDLTINEEVMKKARARNEEGLQRSDRWLITRLWQMKINGEI